MTASITAGGMAAIACAVLMSSLTLSFPIRLGDQLLWMDTLQRAVGRIGPNYLTGLGNTPPLMVSPLGACASTQSLGILNKVLLNQNIIRIQYTFLAQSVEGMESYSMAIQGTDAQPSQNDSVWIVGCDGGFSQTCTPTIGKPPGHDDNSTTRGKAFPMTLGSKYTMSSSFDIANGRIALNITNSSGFSTGIEQSTDLTGLNMFGFLVGRGKQEVSCVTNFAIFN